MEKWHRNQDMKERYQFLSLVSRFILIVHYKNIQISKSSSHIQRFYNNLGRPNFFDLPISIGKLERVCRIYCVAVIPFFELKKKGAQSYTSTLYPSLSFRALTIAREQKGLYLYVSKYSVQSRMRQVVSENITHLETPGVTTSLNHIAFRRDQCPYTRNTFITSSPKWLITLTAMRPEVGLANGRDVSLYRVAQASGSISALSVVLRDLYGSFTPRK